MAPLLVDLFCGAGGASVGYQRAGFRVIGVDNRLQPRYPFEFVQADALEWLATADLSGVAAIHASPPCQDHSPLRSVAGSHGTGWLLAATRSALAATGLPWVIENVPGSPMRADIVLCGAMFGLRTYRHRWFELSDPMFPLLIAHPRHRVRTSTKKRRRDWMAGMNISVTGDVGSWVGPSAMGIDWMTGNELSQAIPPAYAEHVGGLLLTAINESVAA
jgi:DNA (cytosine-5)-methyltransferase 1